MISTPLIMLIVLIQHNKNKTTKAALYPCRMGINAKHNKFGCSNLQILKVGFFWTKTPEKCQARKLISRVGLGALLKQS